MTLALVYVFYTILYFYTLFYTNPIHTHTHTPNLTPYDDIWGKIPNRRI